MGPAILETTWMCYWEWRDHPQRRLRMLAVLVGLGVQDVRITRALRVEDMASIHALTAGPAPKLF
jgi:hypothetical protein